MRKKRARFSFKEPNWSRFSNKLDIKSLSVECFVYFATANERDLTLCSPRCDLLKFQWNKWSRNSVFLEAVHTHCSPDYFLPWQRSAGWLLWFLHGVLLRPARNLTKGIPLHGMGGHSTPWIWWMSIIPIRAPWGPPASKSETRHSFWVPFPSLPLCFSLVFLLRPRQHVRSRHQIAVISSTC